MSTQPHPAQAVEGSGLLALQTAFQAHLLSPPGAEVAPALSQALARGPGLSPQQRLRIYHHAYRMRLVDTLRDSFGHTLRYLGDDWFNTDALAFVEGHPSQQANLRWYGAGFPAWLAQRHPNDPDIAELARLDWTLRGAFDAADAAVMSLADLAAVPAAAWATLRLLAHPSVARLQLQHNTLALWQALDQDEAPPSAAPLAAPGELLVWRLGHSPHFRSLSALEAAAVDQLLQGLGFAAICEALAEQFPGADAAAEAGGLLRRWLDDGLLVGWQ